MFDLFMTVILICLGLFFVLMGMSWDDQNKVVDYLQQRIKLVLWDLYWLSPLSMVMEWAEPIPERIVVETKVETREVTKRQKFKVGECAELVVEGIACGVLLKSFKVNDPMDVCETYHDADGYRKFTPGLSRASIDLHFDVVGAVFLTNDAVAKGGINAVGIGAECVISN